MLKYLNNFFFFSSSEKIRDILNQHLICNWERVNLTLELNNQSNYTPLNQVLKGTVYRHIENLKNRVDEVHIQRIQRLEYINEYSSSSSIDDKNEQIILLDPIKKNNEIEEKDLKDLICCVTKIPSVVCVFFFFFLNFKFFYSSRKIYGEEIYFF